MRFLNALIAFYAALFALAWWGLTGSVVVLVLGILADRALKSHQLARRQNEERARNEALLAQNRDKVIAFTQSGCRFFGSGDHVWEYEHLFDLCASMTDNGISDLRNDQYLIVKTKHGVVLAVNRGGWPADMDQWKTRDILALMVERPTKHFPTSEVALQVDAERRQRELEAIEQRVSSRLRNLWERKSRDIGPGATAIYVISSRGQEHCKIGISDDPEKRRAGLQTGNPSRLAVRTSLWMLNRDHASLMERHTHDTLKTRGYFRIGEWFNVDASVAERIIGEVYDDLLQRRMIIEDRMKISESALASEMLEQICLQIPWRYSKRQNLVAIAFGKRITVFRKSGEWRWVCDGNFSDRAYPSVEEAQLAAIRQIDPPKDQMLDFILERSDG